MAIEPCLNCSDLPKSLAFYTEVMDFRVTVAPDPDPSSFESKYSLLEREGSVVHISSHSANGPFGNKIYVRVNNLDDLYAQFVSRGLNISDMGSPAALRGGPVEQSWGMKEFWVNDPDENVVTFGQPTLTSTRA